MKQSYDKASHLTTRERVLYKSELPETRQLLLEIMRRIGYGRIENLVIRNHQPQWSPPPRIIRDRLLGKAADQPAEKHEADFALKGVMLELFCEFDQHASGLVTIVVQGGLPYKLLMEETAEV